MNLNKKGFTLIELMVVVGIIGIISMIAVPNFLRFQAKAKQANARTELATIYGMEKAFYTEFGTYHGNLHLIGYTPDGFPETSGCPVTTASSLGNGAIRYYMTGFKSAPTIADSTMPTGLGSAPPCPGVYSYLNTVPPASGSSYSLGGDAAAITFTAEADGNVNGTKLDKWTITEAKLLVNSTIGY